MVVHRYSCFGWCSDLCRRVKRGIIKTHTHTAGTIYDGLAIAKGLAAKSVSQISGRDACIVTAQPKV
ncbi:MAG: hypothetical protein ACI91J_001326 [Yoonia sp.]